MNALIPNPIPQRWSKPADRKTTTRAFSLIEILIGVAALGVLSGVGFMAFSGIDDGAQSTKMRSDVGVLNEAVTMYLASGGSLTSANSTEVVLAKLKTRMSEEAAATHTGVSTGSFIDHRLEGEMQTVREAATTQPRVLWNQTDYRFEVKNSGVIGVKRFRLNQALDGVPVATESRSGMFAAQPGTGGWTRDNEIGSDDGPIGPTKIDTEAFPIDPSPTTGPVALNAAIVQIGEGGDLPTALSAAVHEASASTATAGVGALYAPGALPESATASAGDLTIKNSLASKLKREFEKGLKKEVPLERLPTPVVTPPGSGYLRTDFPILVTVADAESYAPLGKIKYRFNDGVWQDYSGGVKITSDNVLQFKAEPFDATTHAASFTTNDFYYGVSDLFSGSSIVQFQEIGGGLNLYFYLSEANTFLTHGNPFLAKTNSQKDVLVEAGEANTMKVMSVSFSDVLPGQQFLLGEVLYHNGTTFDDSHADKAKILFDINFTAPDGVTDVKIPLQLINTDNKGGPDASADVVAIIWPNANRTIRFEVDGRRFLLKVEIVAIDKDGFSDGQNFHVYEGRTARAELRGTFIIDQ